MMRSKNSKVLLVLIIGAIVVSTPVLLMMVPTQAPVTEIKLTLLISEGVMIEAKGLRIYIDPLYLPSNYTDLPADAVLVTHPHTDHYSRLDIELVSTNETLHVFPENMTEQIDRFNGYGVNPGDSFMVGDINITAFYAYMPDYDTMPSFHPKSANWTSYIIEIDGFRIFHAGDSKYMEELGDLSGTIDVALIPIFNDPGFGLLNVSLLQTVDAINLLQPSFTIPFHFQELNRQTFLSEYSTLVENPDCEILDVVYWTTIVFEVYENEVSLVI
jgi:L-ascorbate metabolism protein UlaG (beta-lactamase superfamily)